MENVPLSVTRISDDPPANTSPIFPTGEGIPLSESVRDTNFLGVSDYLRTLFDYKKTVGLIAFAGILAAMLVSLVQPRVYRAEASLEILTPNEDFLNLKDIRPTATPPMYSISAEDSYMKTQLEILQQDWLIERALKRLQLAHGTSSIPMPVKASAGPATIAAPLVEELTVESAKKNLKIEPSHRTRIVGIVYDSGDPNLSAAVANTLAQTFIEYGKEARLHAVRDTQALLQPQLQELKAKLVKSEAELSAFSDGSGLLLTSGRENVAENKLRLVQEELSKAEAERIAKESLYRSASSEAPEALADNDVVRQYRVTLTDLRRQLADLETLLKPESYKVVRLKAQIAELENALAGEVDQARRRLREEYETGRRREEKLIQAFRGQSESVSAISAKMVRYNALRGEMETTQKFYDSMLQKVNEAEMASAIQPTDIRLLGRAQPPTHPHKPNLPLNAALGMATGLFLGVGYVAMKEHGVRRFRVPGDAAVYLRVPELGAIPSAKALPTGPRKLLGVSAGTPTVERISWEQRNSDLSESFRGALLSILSAARTGQSPRAILVTSPLPLEGKTTVVSNLGITLSQVQRNVVLVDGDFRRPRLHEIFCLANYRGVSNLLRDKTSISELHLENLVRPTAVSGLHVLPSGPAGDDIARLLYSERLHELMQLLRAKFDHVLIDAPPCLKFADARMLARYADGVLLVLRAGYTYDKSALAAAQCFLADGIPVLGTILNDWNPRSSPAYGYDRYLMHYGDVGSRA
jgi:capsular exopolysaccharide synthesis family protein